MDRAIPSRQIAIESNAGNFRFASCTPSRSARRIGADLRANDLRHSAVSFAVAYDGYDGLEPRAC